MKNLIIKWLGLDPLAFGSTHLFVETNLRKVIQEEMAKQREENIDLIINRLNNSYDIDGMSSKVDDMHWQIQDLESSEGRWNDMADKMEELDIDGLVSDIEAKLDFDKVQELDDRLTELLAGYKLEVKLTQENY
tara:strand:- start:120 stop:521 length:402 start_codon:yes stop_codon:yes gene_type:complete